ncbi:RHS repeat-associated core domain-containing protein [Paraburkholderia jirisanensis]
MKSDLDTVSLGYICQRRSALTGTYLLGNGYRSFNPIIRRFSAWDSLSPFGDGTAHGYGYCAGDPINASDPSGHLPIIKAIRKITEEFVIERVVRRRGTEAMAREVSQGADTIGRVVTNVVDQAVTSAMDSPLLSAADSVAGLAIQEGAPRGIRTIQEAFGHAGSAKITKVERLSRPRGAGRYIKHTVHDLGVEYGNRWLERMEGSTNLSMEGLSEQTTQLYGVPEGMENKTPRMKIKGRAQRPLDSNRVRYDVMPSSRTSEFDADNEVVQALSHVRRSSSMSSTEEGAIEELLEFTHL